MNIFEKLFDPHIKKTHLYALVKENQRDRFLTITCTPEECSEYAESIIRASHASHFTRWCEIKHLELFSPDSWKLYYDTVITEAEKNEYLILKATYTLDDLATMLRMFNRCIPFACSYDDLREYDYLINEIEDDLQLTTDEEEKKDLLDLQTELISFRDCFIDDEDFDEDAPTEEEIAEFLASENVEEKAEESENGK